MHFTRQFWVPAEAVFVLLQTPSDWTEKEHFMSIKFIYSNFSPKEHQMRDDGGGYDKGVYNLYDKKHLEKIHISTLQQSSSCLDKPVSVSLSNKCQ